MFTDSLHIYDMVSAVCSLWIRLIIGFMDNVALYDCIITFLYFD